MKKVLACAMALALCGSAMATDVNVWVELDQASYAAGDTVVYTVYAELGDSNNEGLALIGFDLEYEGGALTQADEPTADPAMNFAIGTTNAGINNPAGFGGTVIDGKLIQVGGGQNTIKNVESNAPFPIGTVITGVGAPGAPMMVVTGSLVAADVDAMLNVTNVFANVIQQGETGEVFWATEQATVGTVEGVLVEIGVVVPPALESSLPETDTNLWRSENNHVVLSFDQMLPALADGDFKVVELLDGGLYGADLSGSFTLAVAGDVATLTENGEVLSNQTWYGIMPADGVAVAPFVVHLCVQMGDANNDGRVLPNDLSLINTIVPSFSVEPTERLDINGDGRVLPNDLSLANTAVPTLSRPAKPAGH